MIIKEKDIIWSYLAQLFSIASGILVLPFVLNKLSSEEIGFNYILLTLSSFVNIFDFGFSSQFSRNITYVFNGASCLQKNGIVNSILLDHIDYKLLKTLIYTARYLYCRLSICIALFLLIFGTFYIYILTNNFILIPNFWLIWFIYIISIYFNIYFLYYNSLLLGRGLIKEYQKAIILTKCFYIGISILLLFNGCGLLSIVIANMISPFINRYICYRCFYTVDVKNAISLYLVSIDEIKATFKILWYNAKKIGLVYLACFAVSQTGMFFSGMYLSLEDIASYGLMLQLVGIVSLLSSTMISIQIPYFSSCRVKNESQELIKKFSMSLVIFYILFLLGSVLLVVFIPSLLHLIKSNVALPSIWILVLCLVIRLLETNHSNFASLIMSNNNVPFVKAALISGCGIIVGLIIVLNFTNWGILGIVIVPGIVQGCYQNWKWPKDICREFNINYFNLIRLGIDESWKRIISLKEIKLNN